MPPNHAPKNEVAVLDPTEWNFSECPEEERRLCCYYEYLRSSEPVQALFEQFGPREKRQMLVDGIFILDEFNSLINLPADEQKVGLGPSKNIFQPILVLIADIPDFPKKPWLQISPEKRKQLLEQYRSFIRVDFGVTAEQLASLTESRKGHSDIWPETVAVLRIPLGMTADEIIGAFTSELKAYAAEDESNLRKLKGGRGRYADKLNELGALRLLKVMDGDSLNSYTKERLPDETGLYSNKNEFQKAAKKAQSYLDSWTVGH